MEVEIELCRRRIREMKAELESGKKEREDLAKRVKCLERKLEKEDGRMAGKEEKEKERSKLKSVVCKPARKDWNGNELIKWYESESEEEKEKGRKKFRSERKSDASRDGEEEEESFKYRLVAKRSRYARSINMKLGDWLKENFEDIGWKIQDFREGVYFVWLRSEEEQKRMLDRGELLAQEEKFYLEEYVYRKNFEEKKEVLKRKREMFAAKKRLEDVEGERS